MTLATISDYETFVYSLLDTSASILSSTLRVVRTGPAAGRAVGTLVFAQQVRLEVAELVDFTGQMEISQYGCVAWR